MTDDRSAPDQPVHGDPLADAIAEEPAPADAGAGAGVAGAGEPELVEGELVDEPVADGDGGGDIDVEVLIDQLETVTAERDDLRDQVLRSAADFDNLRKRAARERDEVGQAAVGRFTAALLPVLDACDAALDHGVDGVEPIAKALTAALEQQGLTTVGTAGERFDPTWHEAVAHEPGDVEAPVVTEVLRMGYRWSDRVLRPAMVRVKG